MTVMNGNSVKVAQKCPISRRQLIRRACYML